MFSVFPFFFLGYPISIYYISKVSLGLYDSERSAAFGVHEGRGTVVCESLYFTSCVATWFGAVRMMAVMILS